MSLLVPASQFLINNVLYVFNIGVCVREKPCLWVCVCPLNCAYKIGQRWELLIDTLCSSPSINPYAKHYRKNKKLTTLGLRSLYFDPNVLRVQLSLYISKFRPVIPAGKNKHSGALPSTERHCDKHWEQTAWKQSAWHLSARSDLLTVPVITHK